MQKWRSVTQDRVSGEVGKPKPGGWSLQPESADLEFIWPAWSLISFFAKRFDAPFFAWLALMVAVSLPATAQRFALGRAANKEI